MGRVGLLGGLRRLGVRAKASECMELGMWGQICETSESASRTGRDVGQVRRVRQVGRVGRLGGKCSVCD